MVFIDGAVLGRVYSYQKGVNLDLLLDFAFACVWYYL
jgi:hypothetical protein